MNIADLPDDSDTSDEDYVPGGKPEEAPSEVDSDGDPEDPLSESEDVGSRGQKRKKKFTKTKKKAKREKDNSGEEEKPVEESEEDKKKKVDDLWADFMKDTGFKPKNSKNETTVTPPKSSNKTNEVPQNTKALEEKKPPVPQKVKITQIFDFAGEEVKVEKEVAADSAEARLLSKKSDDAKSKPKRGGLSGIGNVLSQLGKKPKISTLEKSKLDWDQFKKEENIEDELKTFNKGKDGYLDRQDFLQRADLRRFEIEKEVRTIERNRRLNNSL